MRLYIPMFVCIASTACGDAGSSATTTATQAALIYGADDRQELFQLRGDDGLRSAVRAVAAVIPRDLVLTDEEGRPQLTAPTLGLAEQLCSGEPFAEQPSAAECTAVLIDDTLLATAGHCFAHAWDCQDYLFIFNYVYAQEDVALQLEAANVYECTRAVVQANDATAAGTAHDFALIELTRKVQDRASVTLRTRGPMLAEPLTVISTTSGVPLKIDRGARVLQTGRQVDDSFALDADTFHGSSGAPVLDAQWQLLGLLSRGQRDFTFDPEAACSRSTRRAPPEQEADAATPVRQVSAEQASPLSPAIAALCARDTTHERLCGVASSHVEAAPVGDAGAPPASVADASAVQTSRTPPEQSEPNQESSPPPQARGVGSNEGCSAAHEHEPPAWWTWVLVAACWRRVRRHSKSSQSRVRHT